MATTDKTREQLIILEGPDGGGKSTLAKQLSDHLQAVAVHHGPYPAEPNPSPAYHHSMSPALRGVRPVVMDRCWLSEPIYGRVFRNGLNRGGVYQRMLERVAMACNAVVVQCLPPRQVALDTFVSRHRRGGEMLASADQAMLVYDGYCKLRELTSLPVITYDYTQSGAFEDLKASLWRAQMAWQPTAAELNVVGNLYEGGWLVIGEGPSPWALRRGLTEPFVNYDTAGCSAWLSKLLDQHRVREAEFAWVNMTDDAGRPRVLEINELLHAYSVRGIITLGEVATAHSRLLTGNLVRHEVPHPNYWKRFHHNEPYELPALLASIQQLALE